MTDSELSLKIYEIMSKYSTNYFFISGYLSKQVPQQEIDRIIHKDFILKNDHVYRTANTRPSYLNL